MRWILRCDSSRKHELARIYDDGGRPWKIQGLCDMQKEEEGSELNRLHRHGALYGCCLLHPY